MKKTWKRLIAAAMTAAIVAGSGMPVLAKEETGPGFPEVSGASSSESTSADVSIYISMMENTLTLRENGQVIGVYETEVGRGSKAGDKNVEGDQRTPIGEFYVCLRNDKSICYLALGVSYPNIEDANRGYDAGLISVEERDAIIQANEEKRQPPWTTALGGYIEIHGDKNGRGTAGCIAVDNSVMDILWEKCPMGVPITIGP